MLPKEIIYRNKKGFGVPIGKWFSQRQLTVENTSVWPLSQPVIKTKIDEHLQQRVDQRAFLWNLWVLNAWDKPS